MFNLYHSNIQGVNQLSQELTQAAKYPGDFLWNTFTNTHNYSGVLAMFLERYSVKIGISRSLPEVRVKAYRLLEMDNSMIKSTDGKLMGTFQNGIWKMN